MGSATTTLRLSTLLPYSRTWQDKMLSQAACWSSHRVGALAYTALQTSLDWKDRHPGYCAQAESDTDAEDNGRRDNYNDTRC